MKKSTSIIIVVVVAIVAFVGGTFYGKASAPVAQTQTAGTFRTRGGGGGANGGSFVAGQITAKDSQSITLQLPNGNSEVVFYSPLTQIMVTKTTTGGASDLATGMTVIISSSTANSDGSVTANAIQVRQGGAGFIRGAGTGGGFGG